VRGKGCRCARRVTKVLRVRECGVLKVAGGEAREFVFEVTACSALSSCLKQPFARPCR